MGDRRVIVVFGATGAQGGSVVRAMKNDDKFNVKAVTRNPDSVKAKELVKQGIEVVKADMDDKASCQDALKGVYGVFIVTNYWETQDEEREVQQGKNVVDAAKELGIKHVVFSAAKSAKEVIGKEGCLNMESKKKIYDYIVETGVPFTTVDLAFYYENLLNTASMYSPKKTAHNEYVLDIPVGDASLGMVSCEGTGEVVHQIFLRPEEFLGKWLSLASSTMTISEYAAIMSKVTGKKFIAGKTTAEESAKLDFKGAEMVALMFECISSTNYNYDIPLTRSLNPAIPTFEQWVTSKKALFETEFQ